MPNDLINALLGQQAEVPPGPSPFGLEPPRPEDTISSLYRSKPAWLQSGMLNAPSGGFPETGRERRSRKSGEFDAGAKDFLSSPANVLSLAGPAGVTAAMAMENQPEKGAMRIQEAAPAGGTKAKPETVAGFDEPRPTLSREDQARLNVMNAEIEKHNATIARHAALKEDKPALYASRTAGALAALQRLTKEASAIEGPHRANTEAWQERLNNHMVKQQETLFQQKQKEAAANERFQVRNPGWGDTAPKYGAGLAGGVGALFGLTGKGKIAEPMMKGLKFGALEGLGTAAFPNLADAGALPFGSQSQQDAAWQMLDPNFLGTKVLPEMGLHGLAGLIGASGASTIPHLINSGASSIKAIAKWLKNPTGAKAPSVPRAKAAPVPPPVVTQPPPMATQPPPILPEAVVPTPVKRTRKKKTTE